jgi:rhodanese-related sulfurtransferase
MALERRTREDWSPLTPERLPLAPDLVVVDSAWGDVQPLQLHPELPTVGELELVEHLDAGLPLLDTRNEDAFAAGTIPGAAHLPHEDLDEAVRRVDRDVVTALFCNGPQCPATPKVIAALLDAGHPPAMLRYYRGGLHDWVSLGYPTAPG